MRLNKPYIGGVYIVLASDKFETYSIILINLFLSDTYIRHIYQTSCAWNSSLISDISICFFPSMVIYFQKPAIPQNCRVPYFYPINTNKPMKIELTFNMSYTCHSTIQSSSFNLAFLLNFFVNLCGGFRQNWDPNNVILYPSKHSTVKIVLCFGTFTILFSVEQMMKSCFVSYKTEPRLILMRNSSFQ